MDSGLPPFEIAADDAHRDLRAHYEAVARQMLQLLWQKRAVVAKAIAAALVLALLALVHMGPRYTGEALINPDFDAAGQPGVSKPGQATITVEAVGVVKSTADMIHSRAVADAVVSRLGLDKDPRFNRLSLPSRGLRLLRWMLGLQSVSPTPRAIAADHLLGRIRVLSGERSYLITIVATTGDPETAATLANAVAAEYWRERTLQGLVAARTAARRNLAQIALVYGPRMPNYQQAQGRVAELEGQVKTLRALPTRDVVGLAAGHALIPAQVVSEPSGPNVPVILVLAVILGFSAGAGLVRYGIEPRLPPQWTARLREFGRRLPGADRLAERLPRRVAIWKRPELHPPSAGEEARFE